MATLKKVKVKRTVFTRQKNAANVKQYIIDCVGMGSVSDLYSNPDIPTAYYTSGTNAATAIQTAINDHALAPTNGNLNTINDKVVLGKTWLDGYADRVEAIANLDANRTTRQEAATNIALSFLTPQKLSSTAKGVPEIPKVEAENVGTGMIDVRIVNGVDYKPSQTTLIMVEESADAVITLDNGQLKVEMRGAGQLIVKAASNKGKLTRFKSLKPGEKYVVYAYAQNGKNQVSDLSTAEFVIG